MFQLAISSCAVVLTLAWLTLSFLNILGLDPVESLNIGPESSMGESSDSLPLFLGKNSNNEIFFPRIPRTSDRFARPCSNYFAHFLLLMKTLRQNG